MKDILKGYKTKIMGWLPAIAVVLAAFGFDVSADDMAEWVRQFGDWLAGGVVLYGALIHWFRSLADKE